MGGNDGSTATSPAWARRHWKYVATPKCYRKAGKKNIAPKFLIKVVTQHARSLGSDYAYQHIRISAERKNGKNHKI